MNIQRRTDTVDLPFEQELRERLGWFIKLRWLAAATVLVGTPVSTMLLGFDLPRLPLYAVGIAVALYNLVFHLYRRSMERGREDDASAFKRFVHLQVGMDWLALIFLTHYSGGIESPIVYYFIFHIFISSMFLSRGACYFHATFAFVLILTMSLLEYYRVVPHVTVRRFIASGRTEDLWVNLCSLGGVLYVSAFLTTSLTYRIRGKENDLFILKNEAERAYEEMETLYAVGKVVASTLDLQKVLDRIAQNAVPAMRVKACSIRLLNEERGELETTATCGLSDQYLAKGPVLVEKSPIDQRALSGRPVLIGDVTQEPGFQYPEEAEREGIRSVLCVPLRAQRKTIGVIRVYCSFARCFTRRETKFLSYLASMGAIAIQNARSYQALEELDRTKTSFVLSVTHELRSPLSAIKSMLAVILDGYVGEIPSKCSDFIRRAEERVVSLLELVGDLLDLAAGKAEFEGDIDPAEVDEVMGEVLNATYGRAVRKGLHIETYMPSETVLRVRVDPQDLERVLINLIDNAVKYTASDGQVSVRVERRDDAVRIEVSDTGIGIAPEAFSRIFDEFYRAENAKEAEREGTGLGLAIAKQIVERYGGRIWVESELGKGTRFVVLLPCANRESGVSDDRIEPPGTTRTYERCTEKDDEIAVN